MAEMVGGIEVTQLASAEPTADQAKLITLAQGAAARVSSPMGCAVLDDQGRSYTGATVQRGLLSLDAVELALGTAASAGADTLTDVVVLARLGTDQAEITHFIQLLGEFIGDGLILQVGDDSGKIGTELGLRIPQ